MMTLELTPQEINVIWSALNEMPVKVALAVMQNIEKQIKKIEDDRKSNSTPTEG